MSERLMVASWLHKKAGKPLREVRHIVFSPPREAYGDVEEIEEAVALRKVANKIFKRAGLKGGVVVYHPWRIQPDVKEFYDWTGRDGTVDIHQITHWRSLVYYSPHYHVLGFGFVEEAGDFFDKTSGWVYKNLGDRKGEREVRGTANYLLSHAGVPLDREHGKRVFHSVTYFGVAAYNKISKVEEGYTESEVFCKLCHVTFERYGLLPGAEEIIYFGPLEARVVGRLRPPDLDNPLGPLIERKYCRCYCLPESPGDMVTYFEPSVYGGFDTKDADGNQFMAEYYTARLQAGNVIPERPPADEYEPPINQSGFFEYWGTGGDFLFNPNERDE